MNPIIKEITAAQVNIMLRRSKSATVVACAHQKVREVTRSASRFSPHCHSPTRAPAFHETFTVRRIRYGEGVERVFRQFANLEKIGKVEKDSRAGQAAGVLPAQSHGKAAGGQGKAVRERRPPGLRLSAQFAGPGSLIPAFFLWRDCPGPRCRVFMPPESVPVSRFAKIDGTAFFCARNYGFATPGNERRKWSSALPSFLMKLQTEIPCHNFRPGPWPCHDAVHKCLLRHLGLPLGCAEIGARALRHPAVAQPDEPAGQTATLRPLGRPRSMFFTPGFHLTVTTCQSMSSKNFEVLHKTPGHPEFHETRRRGDDRSAGAGCRNSVGMAVASQNGAATLNTPGHEIFNFTIGLPRGRRLRCRKRRDGSVEFAGHQGRQSHSI